jgi:bifunctional NMN adenylyltransferase/nudix hydrolase
MQYEYDLLVFIGRFRPFHKGHEFVIKEALKRARHVLVLVGSANRPRTVKNPWTADEVALMLLKTFRQELTDDSLLVDSLNDYMHDNDFHWCMEVQRKVAKGVNAVEKLTSLYNVRKDGVKVGLVGFSKDHTSYYLKKFPQWGSVDVGAYRYDGEILNATEIRNSLLYGDNWWKALVPTPVVPFLEIWIANNEEILAELCESRDYARQYKLEHKYVGKDGKGKPYNATHTTTDSVFIQSNHVLLIKRGMNPGKGLWALPGGFTNEFEKLADSSAREAREETKIGLSREIIDLSFRFKHVFSDPTRSDERGRIITHAYLYLLNDRTELPEVEAGDDAAEAKWFPLGLLDSRDLYSDHYWIIQKMINMIPCD